MIISRFVLPGSACCPVFVFMPEQHETFVLARSFSEEEMDALRCGNIPQAMEDKWFRYMEGETPDSLKRAGKA